MKGIGLYLKEAYEELLYKVTWPTWGELQSSAVVVSVASIIIALIILAMDQASKNALDLIYEII